jgi:hypothetical protein
MRAVRRLLVENQTVDFSYGCAAHALNNGCEDIVKTPAIKESVWMPLYVATTIKNSRSLRKNYESLAKELVGKEYATVLYCSTRWSSVNHMFLRLNQVKDATISIRGVGSADRNPGQIETAFTAPGELSRLTKDPAFWKRIDHALRVFDPTCKMIGILECNSATMAIAYASFLFVRVHIEAAFTGSEQQALLAQLLRRWNSRFIATFSTEDYGRR